MLKQFSHFNIPFEFIDAIDGYLLSEDQIHKLTNSAFTKYILKRNLTKGEIGCYLSHMKAYSRIVTQNQSFGIILEDDVMINDKFISFYHELTKMPPSVDWINLNNHPNTSFFFRGISFLRHKLKKHRGPVWGTYGYIISFEGAKKMLNYQDFVVVPIDCVNKQYGEYPLNTYVIHPGLVETNDPLQSFQNSSLINFPSTIGIERFNNANKSSGLKIKFKKFLFKLTELIDRTTGKY